jgi:hypothetical protein
VFAVLQYHLARLPILQIFYTIVHLLNIIVGDGTIDMIHQRIDMLIMVMALVVLKALQVQHQHQNDKREQTTF